jgi:ABC-type multidrug transport system fused ATPase/permease subunit
LPDGYHTKVGEQGIKLSRGERQRIALARALLKDPPIFIFDEATASLDEHTSLNVQQQLLSVCTNKTTLIISHQTLSGIHVDAHIAVTNAAISQENLLLQ